MTVPDPTRSRGEPRWLGPSTPLRAALIPPLPAARWLLVLVFFAGIYFFHGFLVPVLAALVIGFASWPIYSKLQRNVGGNSTIAATIAITLILAFLVVPITIAVFYTIDEVRQWFTWIVEANRDGAPVPEWMVALPGVGPWIGEQWTKHISTPGSIGALMQVASGANIGNIYRAVLAAGGGAFHLFLTLLFMMIALFFVYRNGEAFAKQVDLLGERILPTRWERISRVVPATISSTVTGICRTNVPRPCVRSIMPALTSAPSAIRTGARLTS